MPSKQKAKGAGFEREVASHLSKLFESSFIRTPHSGAYIGGVNQHRKDSLSQNQTMSFKGDIVPPDDWKGLNIECKFYKEFPWHRFASNVPIGLLETWLGQLLEVEDENDMSLLIMKFNRLGKFVAFKTKFLNKTIDTERHLMYNSLQYGDWTITEYDSFWNLNKDAVLQHCTQANI